jgi:hypothetical protein
MNVMGAMFKDQKKWGNHQSSLRLLLEVVRVFEILKFTTT